MTFTFVIGYVGWKVPRSYAERSRSRGLRGGVSGMTSIFQPIHYF